MTWRLTGKYIKTVDNKWIFQRSRSEPLSDDMASEIQWMYDHNQEQCRWTAFWLLIVFLICLIWRVIIWLK